MNPRSRPMIVWANRSLMTISPLSMGTLISVLNSSPRAYGGVGYALVGFPVRGDSKVPACLLQFVGLP
jgi:hypothetical protein